MQDEVEGSSSVLGGLGEEIRNQRFVARRSAIRTSLQKLVNRIVTRGRIVHRQTHFKGAMSNKHFFMGSLAITNAFEAKLNERVASRALFKET